MLPLYFWQFHLLNGTPAIPQQNLLPLFPALLIPIAG